MRVKHAVMSPMRSEGQVMMNHDMPGMPGDMHAQMTPQPGHVRRANIPGRKKKKASATVEMKP